MPDYSTLTLGALLSHADDIIKRNAMSILKRLQRIRAPKPPRYSPRAKNSA